MPASAQVADPKPNVWRSVLAQAAAVSFDAWATSRFVQNGYVEKDPAVKFIMGLSPLTEHSLREPSARQV